MLSIAQCLLERHEVFIFWDQKDERAIKDQALYKLGIDIRKAVFVPNIFSKNVSLISRIYSSRQYDSIIYLSDGSIPFVLTKLYIHFQFPTEWVKRSLINSLKLKKVSSVFCNSFFTKEYIDKEFGIKSRVLYPPIFIPVFHKVKKENIILNVGRFSINPDGTGYKKQDILVDAFKSMVDNGLKKWRFVLVIGSEEKDREKLLTLEKQAKGYPISIIKNPSNDVLWDYYKRSKIYWHATGFGEDLAKNPERAEHFGISTVEAMGLGAVAVVINAGGQKEIIEDGRGGFLWNTIDDLIVFTTKLINSEKLLIKMSEASIKRSKKFSGDRFCKELNSIIF